MSGTTPGNYTGATTINGGPLGVGSAVTLANAAGAALDVNGFNVAVGSLSGGGTTGGNVQLTNGGTLIVGGGNLISNISNTATRTTFGGQITGTGNLTITGGGLLTLTNNTNSFSGQVNINQGTLVISDLGQLGTGTSPLFVNGVASGSLGSPGLPAGMLVVQGGSAGIAFTRDLSITGRGNNDVGLSLLNIGNNTYSGNLSFNEAANSGRVPAIGASAGSLLRSCLGPA